MKWFTDIIPLLSPYPLWVKGLVSGWIVLTAACAGVLIVFAPIAPSSGQGVQPAKEAWLKIGGVEFFGAGWDDVAVRVEADVNGTIFYYPSEGGAVWVGVGPNMAPGQFKLPQSDVFKLKFSMFARRPSIKTTQLISQRTIVLRPDELPKQGDYQMFVLGDEMVRKPNVSAAIHYAVSDKPN